MPRIEKRNVLIYSREEYDEAAENINNVRAADYIRAIMTMYDNYNFSGSLEDINTYLTFIALNKAVKALLKNDVDVKEDIDAL